MLVSQVALGNTLHVTEHDLDLTSPPPGYDSVHGVKAAADVHSQFKVRINLRHWHNTEIMLDYHDYCLV